MTKVFFKYWKMLNRMILLRLWQIKLTCWWNWSP
jgi:hypothetical protein